MPEATRLHNGASVLAASRQRMLDLLRRHVRDERVIDAMAAIPRERFVPPHMAQRAYDDSALAIGAGQTISQPLIVGLMLDALQLSSNDHVLEVGTGSGYAAAVLSRLARDVVTVERITDLGARAGAALAALRIENVRTIFPAKHLGYKEDAPYDAVLISAGAPHIPRSLLDQLAEGGRLIVPIGPRQAQQLVRAIKTPTGVTLERLGPCAFVPLIDEEAWHDGMTNGVSRRSILR
jgi:protein-L-isoaspartate(D-aspartate) O-methyltransferase